MCQRKSNFFKIPTAAEKHAATQMYKTACEETKYWSRNKKNEMEYPPAELEPNSVQKSSFVILPDPQLDRTFIKLIKVDLHTALFEFGK